MNRLNILSPRSPLHRRNTLFEEIITDVLRHNKYRIDRIVGVSQAMMQIDAQGQYTSAGLPFYAECRCYDHPISASELQAFYGKYMTWWHKNNMCHGIFMALPCLDNPAKEFYKEHIEKNPAVTAYLFEDDDVLNFLSAIHGIVSAESFKRPIAQNIGRPGHYFLLYTERGMFWVQYIVSHGKKTPPDRIALFNIDGTPLSDPSVLDYVKTLYPEFDRLENITIGGAAYPQPGLFHGTDEVVEVSGSSGLLDYHLPASYEGFVGRKSLLEEFHAFANEVMQKKTSLRSMLLAAPSGWGKSSLVLACAAKLNALGHAAVAIDSRTASSTNFVVRVFDHAINTLEQLKGAFKKEESSTGHKEFDGSVEAIQTIGKELESQNRLLVIFFDQFENIFFMPDLLKGIRGLFLNVCSARTNVVLCFSWKTNLSEPDNELLHNVNRLISESSRHLLLTPFSRDDITLLFDKLSDELDKAIDKNLRSVLSQLSQGYPWLLKKWFDQVATIIRAGGPMSDVSKRTPSVADLFQENVQSLTVKERDALLYIAKAAPVPIFDADQSFEHQVVQNLMARKLVIKIGSVCDVYSDIFRDYLVTGELPLIENYVFQAQVADVLNAVKILAQAGGSMNLSTFKDKMRLAKKSLSKIIHEMNVLGLAKSLHGNIALQMKEIRPSKEMDASFRLHLKERLRNHRPTQIILRKIKKDKALTLDEMSQVLKAASPNIAATEPVWMKYARTLAKWMDVAGMALLEPKKRTLVYLNPETDIRERDLLLPKRRGSKTPWIQYAHVQQIATRLVQALDGNNGVDWRGLGKSTIFRALAALEDLGFILRSASAIKVLPKGIAFVRNPDKRSLLFAESALKIPSFSIFVDILNTHQDKGNTLLKLGLELRDTLGTNWKESTAEVVAKVLLDWARHAKLAPGVFVATRRGPIKGSKKKEDRQLTLF